MTSTKKTMKNGGVALGSRRMALYRRFVHPSPVLTANIVSIASGNVSKFSRGMLGSSGGTSSQRPPYSCIPRSANAAESAT